MIKKTINLKNENNNKVGGVNHWHYVLSKGEQNRIKLCVETLTIPDVNLG